jgi:glycosyltransferase involved in cell wall biosynthesis
VGNLPNLLRSISEHRVVVVDDGSRDGTSDAAIGAGVELLVHPSRLGKTVSLKDGIEYAANEGYDAVVDIGADAIPEAGSVSKLVQALEADDVGGACARQIPVRSGSRIAHFIDELIWSILAEGKEYQMRVSRDCYLGGVMFAFKLVPMTLDGGTNDDELVGNAIRAAGMRVVYVKDAVVYFDSSSNLHHILDRRVRMNFGHRVLGDSGAPSVALRVASIGIVKSIAKSPRRLASVIPAIGIEIVARLWAWYDFRHRRFEKYQRWVSRNKSKTALNYESMSDEVDLSSLR